MMSGWQYQFQYILQNSAKYLHSFSKGTPPQTVMLMCQITMETAVAASVVQSTLLFFPSYILLTTTIGLPLL